MYRGTLRPAKVLRLAQHLPDDGAFAASLRFHSTERRVRVDPSPHDFRGWGHDRYLLAAIFDAVNLNTRATGQWGKGKAPKFDPYPRPKRVLVQRSPLSLADLAKRLS